MPQPVAPKPRRSRALVAVLGVIVVLVLALAVFGALMFFVGGTPPLREAYTTCGSKARIADGDTTLILDMAGEERGTGTLTLAEVRCHLDALGVPTYITERMGKTRALDGRQTELWDRYELSWTFHPDNGLDVMVRDLG